MYHIKCNIFIMAPDFGKLLYNGEILSESVCMSVSVRGGGGRGIYIVNIFRLCGLYKYIIAINNTSSVTRE